jgi:hypothetical protein
MMRTAAPGAMAGSAEPPASTSPETTSSTGRSVVACAVSAARNA